MIWGYFIVINLFTFIIYGIDKYKAKKHLYRIPEKVLIGLAFAGGCIGAAAGMEVFHHKTRHRNFQLCIPISCMVWGMGFYFLLK